MPRLPRVVAVGVQQKGSAASGTLCPATPGATNPFGTLSSNNYRGRWFVYDSLSRLTDAYNPETGHTNWTYDADSNVHTKTDAKGQTITYTYDAENRVTGKTYSAGDHAVTYSYDQASYNGLTITNGKHHRTGMSDAAGTTAWSFDERGRTITERRTIGTVTKTIGTAYNVLGLPTSLTYPNGTVVAYGYDPLGRVAGVSDTTRSLSYVTGSTASSPCLVQQNTGGVSYTAAGAPTSYLVGYQPTLSNYGINVIDCYNSRLQPKTLTATPVSTSLPSVLNYTYAWNEGSSDNGDLVTLTNNNDTTRSKTFTYDAYNRISSYKTPSSTLWYDKYTIDAWGNLTAKTPQSGYGGETLTPSGANNANQLLGYSYDGDGNLTSGDGNTYTYDSENRIKTAAGVTYTYDGDGSRVQKSSGETYWGGGAGHALMESDNSGTPTAEYIYFLGKMLARRDLPSGTVKYYFGDHLGSASVLTDIQGNIYKQYDYAPYGELHWQSGTDTNHYLFTGKERDTETGNDYFGARYHESAMGRFLTPDWSATPEPIPYANLTLPQTINLYGYVGNNPPTGVDPQGHCDGVVCTAAGFTFRALATTATATAAATVAAAGAVVASAYATIKRTSDAYIANQNDKITLAAIESKVAAENAAKLGKTPVKPYDVGTASDLKGRSVTGDKIDIHHVPQAGPAAKLDPNYDKKQGPAIALPEAEHESIPTLTGDGVGNMTDQIVKDLNDLQTYTNAPQSALDELQKIMQEKYAPDTQGEQPGPEDGPDDNRATGDAPPSGPNPN